MKNRMIGLGSVVVALAVSATVVGCSSKDDTSATGGTGGAAGSGGSTRRSSVRLRVAFTGFSPT